MKTEHPLTYNIAALCETLGIKRTKAYLLIGAGELDARKLGGKTVVLAESAQRYVANLPKADIRTGQKAAA